MSLMKRFNITSLQSNIIFVSFKIAIISLRISLTISCISGNVMAAPQRVAQIDFDLKKVFKLYSSPGRDTSLYFPCNVEYATAGTDNDLKLSLPKKFPNLVTVFLLHGKAQSTSLKVFCSEKVFVFDVVPSTDNHIDFLKIVSTHGELPRFSEEKNALELKTLIETVRTPEKAKITGKMIYSSKERQNTWQK